MNGQRPTDDPCTRPQGSQPPACSVQESPGLLRRAGEGPVCLLPNCTCTAGRSRLRLARPTQAAPIGRAPPCGAVAAHHSACPFKPLKKGLNRATPPFRQRCQLWSAKPAEITHLSQLKISSPTLPAGRAGAPKRRSNPLVDRIILGAPGTPTGENPARSGRPATAIPAYPVRHCCRYPRRKISRTMRYHVFLKYSKETAPRDLAENGVLDPAPTGATSTTRPRKKGRALLAKWEGLSPRWTAHERCDPKRREP